MSLKNGLGQVGKKKINLAKLTKKFDLVKLAQKILFQIVQKIDLANRGQKIDSGGNTLVVAAYFCWFDSLYNIINEKCICNILLQAITN